MSDDPLLKELRDEFLESARVDLEDWESDLLDYDSGEVEKMKNVLRLIHSMKGSSQAIGLVDLGACMHELENWLARAEESAKPSSQIASVALAIVDHLRAYCSVLTKGQDGSGQLQAIRALLV